MRVDIKYKDQPKKQPGDLPQWLKKQIDNRMRNLICKQCKKHPRQNGSSRCVECAQGYASL